MSDSQNDECISDLDLVERSDLVLGWAKRCAERADRFRREDRHLLAEAQMQRCCEHLKLSLALYAGNVSARFFLVGTLMLLGDFSAAKECAIETLRELCEDHAARLQEPILHLAIAHASARLGQAEDAVAFLQVGTDDFPLHPQPCAELSRMMNAAGRYGTGLKMARAALERDSDPNCPREGQLPKHVFLAVYRCLGECLACEEGIKDCAGVDLEARLKEIAEKCGISEAEAVRDHLVLQRARTRQSEEDDGGSNGAVRYGRVGMNPVASQAFCEPARVGAARLAPQSSAWNNVLKMTDSVELEREGLGVHVVLVDSLPVREDASWSSPEVACLFCQQTVTILSLKYHADEAVEWGRIESPEGWIPLSDLKIGVRWTRSAENLHWRGMTRATRSKDFGPPDDIVTDDEEALKAAALGDLERLFSGLLPGKSRAPNVDGLDHDVPSVGSKIRHKCFACCTSCCTCRNTCEFSL